MDSQFDVFFVVVVSVFELLYSAVLELQVRG